MRHGSKRCSAVGRVFPVLLVISVVFLSPTRLGAESVRMLYMAQAGYQPQAILDRAREFQRQTGIGVDLTFAEYEDQYNLITSSVSGASPMFDVILLDLIWTADFASRGLIDPVPASLVTRVQDGVPQALYQPFQYRGELWSYPFLANFQLLFTNMSLLRAAGATGPPSSLEELVRVAEAAKSAGVSYYPIFVPWKKQEVLVCDFVWLVGAYGGDLDVHDGRLLVNTRPALRALTLMVDMLHRGLVNPYSLQSDELFSADAFLWGDALFTVNWNFMIGRMQEVPFDTKPFVASPIPASSEAAGATTTVSGYQGLSVMRRSDNKRAAWEFVAFLSSQPFARAHLEEMPVWRDVWSESWTREHDRYIGVQETALAGVHDRPVDPRYRSVSAILQDELSAALTDKVSPAEALAAAQSRIDSVLVKAAPAVSAGDGGGGP